MRHLYIKCIILPRQARDKHRESTQKRVAFRIVDTTETGARGTAPSSVIAQIAKDTKPVDCYGPAGTCIFWHHRGMHAAGPNFSDRLRLAVLYEWARTQIDDGPPPVDDMWRDWSEEVRAVGPEYGAITDDANRTGLPAAEIGTHEARKIRHDQADRGARL